MTIKTTRAKGYKFPWNHLMSQKIIDLSKIKIKSDPLPLKRYVSGGKYDPILRKLKIGQNLECEPNAVGSLSQALRKYIKQHNIKATVVIQTKGEDGLGRVWLAAKEQ